MSKLIRPITSRNGILDLPEIYELLNGLEECNVVRTLERLKAVLKLLGKNPELCNHFCKLGGVQTIVSYLCNKDNSIAEMAFFILAHCADNDKGTRIELANEKVFAILSKSLQDLEHCSYKIAPCIMFLLTSIIQGSGIGQTLVQESMCQYYLVVAFHRLMQLMTFDSMKEEKLLIIQTWTSLCLAMKSCIANPQNKENQHQLGLILPKGLAFIENWFAFGKCDNAFKGSVECLITLLTQIISNNVSNQLNFSVYHGMPITIRGIALMENSQDPLPDNDQVLEKLIHLLDASISDNASNCTLATAMGAIPILIKMLHKVNNKHKIAVMITLAHLVGMNAESQEEFAKHNGVAAVALAMVNADEFPQVRKAANCLLQYCTQNISISMLNKTNDSLCKETQRSPSHLHHGSLNNLQRSGNVPMTPIQLKMDINKELSERIHQNKLSSIFNYYNMNKQLLPHMTSDLGNHQLLNNIGCMLNRKSLSKDQFDQQYSGKPETEDNQEILHNEMVKEQYKISSEKSLGKMNGNNEQVFVKPQPPRLYKCNKNKRHTNEGLMISNRSYEEYRSPNASVGKKPRGITHNIRHQNYHKLGTNSVLSYPHKSYHSFNTMHPGDNETITNSSQTKGRGCYPRSMSNECCNVAASMSMSLRKHRTTSERNDEHKPHSHCGHSEPCYVTTPKNKKSYSVKKGQSFRQNNKAVYDSSPSIQTKCNVNYIPTSNQRIGHWLKQHDFTLTPGATEHHQQANSVRTHTSYNRIHFQGNKETSSNHQVQYDTSESHISPPQCSAQNFGVQSRSEVEKSSFSEEEIENLTNGVFTYGMNFKAILAAYKFHPTRSSADLLLKWKSH